MICFLMINKIKNILLFLFGMLYSLLIFPQVNDAALWLSINAEKKINPLLSVNLSQEFRINENITELGTFFTDAGITYKINKYIRFSANYRFTNKRRFDDSYSKRHRYYFDITVREKTKSFVFQFRTRFQSQYADIYSSADGKIPSYYSRNKFTTKIDLDKKITPYISVELFSPLNKHKIFKIDNARYCGGFEYEINRMHSFDLFYMLQREYNVNNPQTDYILGIEYNIVF